MRAPELIKQGSVVLPQKADVMAFSVPNAGVRLSYSYNGTKRIVEDGGDDFFKVRFQHNTIRE